MREPPSHRFPAAGRATGASLALTLSAPAASCPTVNFCSNATSENDSKKETSSSLNWEQSDLAKTVASADDDALSIDLENTHLTIGKSNGLNIAFFNAAIDTTYIQARAEGAEDMAKKFGGCVAQFEVDWGAKKYLPQAFPSPVKKLIKGAVLIAAASFEVVVRERTQ